MSSNINPSEDPNFEPKKQGCGYTIAFLACLLLTFDILHKIFNMFAEPDQINLHITRCLGNIFVLIFYLQALIYPAYIGGSPGIVKLWPMMIGYVFILKSYRMIFYKISGSAVMSTFICIILYVVLIAINYAFFIRDDTNPGTCCIFFKPWVYRRKEAANGGNHQYGVQAPQGYPPYGAPPPQGYPPRGAQGQAPQGYPSYGAQAPQGYPPQGHPQNMMQLGNPQQGPPAYQPKK